MLGKVLLDGGSVEVVLVVSGSRHDEEAVGKAGAVLDTSDNMTVNATRPLILASVSHSTK